MRLLYTTEQIAQMYSGQTNNVTPYMITHTWIPNGLRHVNGKGKGYLYKKEWVEEYLENQATINETQNKNFNIKKGKTKIANQNCYVI